MAKIAVALERAVAQRAASGADGRPAARPLAGGEGWSVEDVICTSGPNDKPFEERHHCVSIALVLAGVFHYRSTTGRECLTPGAAMLGNPGQTFECSHEHGEGDRCLSFRYSPDYFEKIAADAGGSGRGIRFQTLRLPAMRDLSPLVARGCAAIEKTGETGWEEFAVRLAARVVQIASASPRRPGSAPPGAEARVTRMVRSIERNSNVRLNLTGLAKEARLSPYHFLRIFERITGLTPHQYILRTRLREAATQLAEDSGKVLDVALDCGFGDVSNFNRAFRREFGTSPRTFRRRGAAL